MERASWLGSRQSAEARLESRARLLLGSRLTERLHRTSRVAYRTKVARKRRPLMRPSFKLLLATPLSLLATAT